MQDMYQELLKVRPLTHERNHTEETLFKCSDCNKTFSQACNLRGTRKEYPECAKSFSIAGHLQEHERTHKGEMPLKCAKCDKSFNIKLLEHP